MSNLGQRILLRKAGRDIAEQCIELASLKDLENESVDAFWDEIRKAMPSTEKQNSAMSSDEAEQFEHEKIEFGKHAGELYINVPIEYLCWIADQSIRLRRYCQSERAQRRQS